MDAVAALAEIAFLLERERAAPFKVKAFRSAQAILSELSPDEIAARTADGRLQRMRGIGDTTAQVVREAVDGNVPTYLQDLRDRQKPLATGGARLRAQLRGDLHTHSDRSDGTTSIEAMAGAAAFLGHDYFALTDHSPNLKIANGLTAERLAKELDDIAALNTSAPGVRILTGIEVDILEDGALDQTPAMLDRLDVVVASVHSKLRADRATMTRRMLGGIRDPHTNVLGHCTGRMVEGRRGERPQSTFDAKRVFAECAERNVAVEINSRPERQDPPDDLIAIALAAGCLFSIDSDAHAPGQMAFLDLGAERAAANRVPADRIITTWPVDQLLNWSKKVR